MLHRLLLRIDPERAHVIALHALRIATPLVRLVPQRVDHVLEVHAFGRVHSSPLGVAAGLDKDARVFEALGLLGFGHVEIGTVTLDPQPGNERPRIFRRRAERALVNRMGFPSEGAEAVATRLERRPKGLVIGANVSRRRDGSLAEAAAAARRLAPLVDYLVVNVSSPNTPGLRDLQSVERLREVVEAVRPAVGDTPLLVKIAPDLADDDVVAIAHLARELRLEGIVATNTTIVHDGPQGGLSGPPLRARSLEVLRLLRANVDDDVVLVSVGGVETADDVLERIDAGATLVQAYTAFVYGGPRWPSRVNRELAKRLRKRVAKSDNRAKGW
ncbi:MAG TPA: quinone-dependent dihydroorotate dehydrogenase [Gaiellaceae bacterium]